MYIKFLLLFTVHSLFAVDVIFQVDMQDEIAEEKGYEIVKHVHQLFVKKIKK